LRIAIHDYAGHPFQFELSRELARRGHLVRHFYFAEDIGPKGASATTPDDPPTLSIEPISMGGYSKTNLIRRRQGDIRYGKVAAKAIAAFSPDVVLSGNTPVEAQQQIMRAAAGGGSAFIFWVQDFFGLATERLLAKRWLGLGRHVARHYGALEARLLRESDGVVVITDDFKVQLDRCGVDPFKVAVIPNWGALDSLPEQPKDNSWSRDHDLADKFVFLYSGTLALKHNPSRLLALARAFADDPAVRVVLAASGVSVDQLKAAPAGETPHNLVFLPLQPIGLFPRMLGAADVLVALLEADAGEFSVPSKVLSYLCAGRPTLLSAPGGNLASRIIDQAEAGLCVAAEDETAFLAAARRLREDAAWRQEAGTAARAYAEANFEITGVADRFMQLFHRLRPDAGPHGA
jgi:glycosyltransferase involved in cell wall biosynthesis